MEATCVQAESSKRAFSHLLLRATWQDSPTSSSCWCVALMLFFWIDGGKNDLEKPNCSLVAKMNSWFICPLCVKSPPILCVQLPHRTVDQFWFFLVLLRSFESIPHDLSGGRLWNSTLHLSGLHFSTLHSPGTSVDFVFWGFFLFFNFFDSAHHMH